MRGDYQRAIDTNIEDPPFVSILALDIMGSTAKQSTSPQARGAQASPTAPRSRDATRSALECKFDECRPVTDSSLRNGTPRPCGSYYVARS